LALVSTRDLSAIVIKAPDERLLLTQPAFDPTGTKLAFVATPLGGFGISEIWIFDRNQRRTQGIPSRGKSYQFPAFSPDGLRISYFRDVQPPPAGARHVLPEYRRSLPYALFQRSLGSMQETVVADQPFLSPCGLYYDLLDRGLYYCATLPVVALRDSDGLAWVAPPWGGAYHYALQGSANFFLRWGESISVPPRLYAPTDDAMTHSAQTAGALDDGSILLKSVVNDHARYPGLAIGYDGSRLTEIFAADRSLTDLASDERAQMVVGVHYRPVANGIIQEILLHDRSGTRVITRSDIRITETITLEPLGTEF
jgi:hypothetical protein